MPVDEMPKLGIGTWENTDGDECAGSVLTALDMGYRHVDTAQAYGNGEHIRDNYGALDLELDDDDVERIDGIDREERQVDPDFAPWN